jgi:hypothetical protein
MKRFVIFAFIASIVIFGFFYLAAPDLPVKYNIGQIDNRFGLSQEEITAMSEDVAARWNKAMGKEVLVYDADAKLKINLVYDQRQANLNKLMTETTGLNLANTNISSAKKRLEDEITEFEKDLEAYNRDVQHWNNIGGAPKEQYQKLQKRRQDLESRENSLIRAAQLLDSNIDSYNRDLSSLRDELKENKGKVEESGIYEYPGEKINIYMFGDKNELRLILMHEFGHALGAKHTDNPASVMYPLMEKQNFEDPVPLQEDINAVEKSL